MILDQEDQSHDPDKPGQPSPARSTVSKDALWITGSRLVSQLSGLGLLLVAARILSPAEVGQFAVMSAIVVFLTLLGQAGWSERIIGWPRDETLPPTLLWAALVSAGLVAGVGFVAIAVWKAVASPGETLSTTISLLVASVPVGAFVMCQTGVLIRGGRMRHLATFQIVSEIFGLATGIIFLLLGWGIIALAASRLAAVATAAVMSFSFARWRPAFEWEGPVAREASAYASRLLLSRCVQFAQAYAAEFLIVLFLGAAEVGIFRIAGRIVGAVTELVSEPVRVLSWSYLSNTHSVSSVETTRRRARLLELVIASVVFIALPIFAGLAFVSGDIVALLLGDAWLDAIPVIWLLCAARVVYIVQLVTEPALSLMGRVSVLPRLNALLTSIALIALFIAGIFSPGLNAIAAAQVVAMLANTAITLSVLERETGLRAGEAVRKTAPAILAVVAMVVSISGIMVIFAGGPQALRPAAIVLAGATTFCLISWKAGKKLLAEINDLSRSGEADQAVGAQRQPSPAPE